MELLRCPEASSSPRFLRPLQTTPPSTPITTTPETSRKLLLLRHLRSATIKLRESLLQSLQIEAPSSTTPSSSFLLHLCSNISKLFQSLLLQPPSRSDPESRQTRISVQDASRLLHFFSFNPEHEKLHLLLHLAPPPCSTSRRNLQCHSRRRSSPDSSRKPHHRPRSTPEIAGEREKRRNPRIVTRFRDPTRPVTRLQDPRPDPDSDPVDPRLSTPVSRRHVSRANQQLMDNQI